MPLKAKKGLKYWEKKLIGQGGILNEYVKRRDAVDFTEDGKPICICITCSNKIQGTNLHAGHWISRRHKATAFMEENIHAQCGFPCNKYNHGEPQIYERKLREMYGDEKVEQMLATVGVTKKWKPYELEELYYYYKDKLSTAN